jgi:precorrin-6B methylase 2
MREIDQADLLQFHAFLLASTADRISRYQEALTRTLSPGDVVVDLGSGTAILALLALRAGASRVYALEASDAIELARSVCAAHEVGDRIVLLHGASFGVELPQPADLLIADIYDCFGLQPGGVAAIIDARRRLLTGAARLIPSALQLHVAAVESDEVYDSTIAVWTRAVSGVDMSSLHACAVNNRYARSFDRAALLSDPAPLARIDLARVERAEITGSAALGITRSGTLHGVCGWFAAELADAVTLDNSPGSSTSNYRQAFFPIEHPIAVAAGDVVGISIQTYDNIGCKWQIEVNARPHGPVTFQHSTLLGFPLSAERLDTLRPTFTPRLSQRAEAERFVLGLCDGQHTVDALVDGVGNRYAELFRSREEAAGFVNTILARIR